MYRVFYLTHVYVWFWVCVQCKWTCHLCSVGCIVSTRLTLNYHWLHWLLHLITWRINHGCIKGISSMAWIAVRFLIDMSHNTLFKYFLIIFSISHPPLPLVKRQIHELKKKSIIHILLCREYYIYGLDIRQVKFLNLRV